VNEKEGSMTTLDALNAGLKFINNPTKENAIAMTEPFSNDWTKKFDELERRCEKSIAYNALLREALEVACGEVEYLNLNSGKGYYYPCPHFVHEACWPECDKEYCRKDIHVCWIKYCSQCAQECIDMRKNNEEVKNEL
jgi:hypothetical protein